MTRAEKTEAIQELKDKFAESSFFYLTDSSTLTVGQVNELRGKCHEANVEMKVVKNTLARKALEQLDNKEMYEGLYEVLAGPTAVMFADTANQPARIIEDFRKTNERPLLKAAYIDQDIYLGDDQLKSLAALKSKEELVGDVIALLQSPMQTLVGALKSSGNNLSGLLKALEERG